MFQDQVQKLEGCLVDSTIEIHSPPNMFADEFMEPTNAKASPMLGIVT